MSFPQAARPLSSSDNYPDTGGGGQPISFGPPQVISQTSGIKPEGTFTDVDQDGDLDLITWRTAYSLLQWSWGSLCAGFHNVTWFENTGSSQPWIAHDIVTNTSYVNGLVIADLDHDSDMDLLLSIVDLNSAASLVFVENLGLGVFAPSQPVSGTSSNWMTPVHAGPITGGSASDLIAWIPNRLSLYKGIVPTMYSGSFMDFDVDVSVNASPPMATGVHSVSAGDTVTAQMHSLSGAYDQTPVVLAAQAFPSGSPPAATAGLPELHLDPGPNAPFPVTFIYGVDAANALNQLLPSNGVSLSWTIPPSVGPISFLLQGFALAPSSQNPALTASHGHEIQIQ